MENPRSALHPLLTAAAISVTLFSAVGVATLTGLLPASVGSQAEVSLPPAPAEAAAPSVAAPATPPAAKPSPEPAAKPAARTKAAPAPGMLATVEEVKEVTTPGEHSALGPIAGGVAGAVVGSQIGNGNGRKVLTVLGALGGAMAGKHIEKQARGARHWQTVVRLADGSLRTVQSRAQPFWNSGERVRYVDGRLQPA